MAPRSIPSTIVGMEKKHPPIHPSIHSKPKNNAQDQQKKKIFLSSISKQKKGSEEPTAKATSLTQHKKVDSEQGSISTLE